MLTPVEAFWLRWHAEHAADADDARRARILLLAAQAAPAEAIAQALGLAAAAAVSVVGQFARRRLSDFPRPVLTLDQLLTAAQVDRAHAAQVADLAVELFDSTRSLHRLPIALRRVLETAGMLHNVGLALDEARHHTVGRDLLRACDIVELRPAQRLLIACVVGFHRKKVRPESDPGLAALSRTAQRQALALAAILRVADGLDSSQTRSTSLLGALITPEKVTLRLGGPEAGGDGARAQKKADLWETVFHLPLDVAAPDPVPADLAALARIPLTPASPISDAVRRALAIHLGRWQAHETPALAGEADSIKVVRVSARRMHAALTVFRAAFKRKPAKKLRAALLELETVLGRVRDLDVLLTDARAYYDAPDKKAGANQVAALITAWEKARARALADAEAWLGSPAATDLQSALTAFISAPPVRADDSLRSAGPGALRALLAEVVDRQRKLTPEKPRSYHRLRLAFKNLRYALEFLQPALAPEAGRLRSDLATVQDRLGALNDTRTLEREVAQYLDAHAEQQARRKAPQLQGAQGVLEYAQSRRGQWTERIKEFDQDFGPVRATKLRRRLSEALQGLRDGSL